MVIIPEYRIEYKYGDSFRIKPLFDTHIGNAYCDIDSIKRYLSDTDDKTYIIGGGDTLDSVIVGDKRYAKHVDVTVGDAIVDEQIEIAYDILKPYANRIIGLGSGNHEATISHRNGTHPTRRLSQMLGVKHLGYSWLVKLMFSENGGRVRSVLLRGHHGWGGGSRTQGADLTKYSKDAAYWDADIFLYGHVHRRQSDMISRLSLVGKTLVSKPKHMFICGTFLKTLSLTDDATYSEMAGYPPTPIGGVNITIRPTNKWVNIESDV